MRSKRVAQLSYSYRMLRMRRNKKNVLPIKNSGIIAYESQTSDFRRQFYLLLYQSMSTSEKLYNNPVNFTFRLFTLTQHHSIK